MASYVYLDDICRFCLKTHLKESNSIMLKITEACQKKFQEVTQQNVNKQMNILNLSYY